ncbi:hypothetical protein D3C75_1256550 [compost metagenome]
MAVARSIESVMPDVGSAGCVVPIGGVTGLVTTGGVAGVPIGEPLPLDEDSGVMLKSYSTISVPT